VRRLRDQRSSAPAPVITPKIILIKRLEILPTGITEERWYQPRALALDCRRYAPFGRPRGGLRQSAHLIVMRLCGVLRVFALPVQRVFRKCGRQQAPFAVHNRNANAEGSNLLQPQCHVCSSLFASGCCYAWWAYISSRNSEWRLRAPSGQHWKNSPRRGARNRSRKYNATAFVIPESPRRPHRRSFQGIVRKASLPE